MAIASPQLEMKFEINYDIARYLPSLMTGLCSRYGPSWTGLQARSGKAAKARMRPVGVVVRSTFLDQPASTRQISEHVLVQAFVPEAAVQALDEAVLHGLAWCDVVPLDPAVFLPLQDRARGQLGAVAHWEEARPLADGARSLA